MCKIDLHVQTPAWNAGVKIILWYCRVHATVICQAGDLITAQTNVECLEQTPVPQVMASRRRSLVPEVAPAAEGALAGSRRWRRNRQSRQCMKPGCERHYVRCKHKHCCSLCSFGQHTERCDDDWQLFQERQQRERSRTQITPCATGCGNFAGVGHVHCCTLCVRSQGRDHTQQCQARQQLAHVAGGPSSTGDRPDLSLESVQSTRDTEDVEMIDVEMMDATTGIGSAATSSAATSSTSPLTTEQHRMLLASTILANHLIEPIEVLDSEEEAADDMLNQMD